MALRITGAYIACVSLAIVLGDGAVARWLSDLNENRLKGALFVMMSALLLYEIVWRLLDRFEAADAALRENDERWTFAFRGTGDGVWDYDLVTKRHFRSPRWKEILGYGDAEIGLDPEEWQQRIHPEDRQRVEAQLTRHYAGEAPMYECEYRLRTKDGSYKWVLSRGRVARRSPDGRATRIIGAITDITARKLAEERVKDALNLTQTVLQSAPVGIMTYRATGETISANEAGAALAGTNVAGLLQQNFRRLESWRKHGMVAAADQALGENTVTFIATRFTSTFGRVIWCEMTFAPFDYEGERRLMLIVQDTSKQHAVQERLELLQAALQAAPTGWVITDASGVIEWVNPGFTQLTGYAFEEVVGKNPNVLKSGRHTAGFYAHLWETVRAGRIWQGEISNRHKNGAVYFERMTIAPVRDADGAIAHFVAMKENITGQHELQQQLERAQRLESIGLLASGIAHDLNNVLAPILLSMSLVKEWHRDAPTQALLDSMQTTAQRGAGIVKQVLTFARGMEGERVQLDLRSLIKELANFARETFPREIRVVVVVPATPLSVDGDVTQLHQVLLNLAINARDAMAEGGVLTFKGERITLDAAALRRVPGSRPGDYVKLSVADTGIGMAPEVMERLFEPFFTTKPRGRGTGLGLSTVYGLVRSHGGFIDVRSQPGHGTEFEVFLPADNAQVAPAAKSAETGSTLAGAGRRVLLVDDEENIRLVTGEVLRRKNFEVIEAKDGVEAVSRLRESPASYSCAIVDLLMPEMNGYKLISEIRRIVPELPVIVASGMAGDLKAGEVDATLAAVGVREFLAKPFGETALLAALEAALGKTCRTRVAPPPPGRMVDACGLEPQTPCV